MQGNATRLSQGSSVADRYDLIAGTMKDHERAGEHLQRRQVVERIPYQ